MGDARRVTGASHLCAWMFCLGVGHSCRAGFDGVLRICVLGCCAWVYVFGIFAGVSICVWGFCLCVCARCLCLCLGVCAWCLCSGVCARCPHCLVVTCRDAYGARPCRRGLTCVLTFSRVSCSADFSCAGMGKSSRRKGYRGFRQEGVHHAMRGMELSPGFVRRKKRGVHGRSGARNGICCYGICRDGICLGLIPSAALSNE